MNKMIVIGFVLFLIPGDTAHDSVHRRSHQEAWYNLEHQRFIDAEYRSAHKMQGINFVKIN